MGSCCIGRPEGSPQRAAVVNTLRFPMTASQLARAAGLTRAACSRVLADLARQGVASCLNPRARRSRVYALRTHRRAVPSGVDWDLFGWVSFRHRAAIVKAITTPQQPAEIRRRARWTDPTLRISASNTRDVVRLLLRRGVVSIVMVRRRGHRRYQLTPAGIRIRDLLTALDSMQSPRSTASAHFYDPVLHPLTCTSRSATVSLIGDLGGSHAPGVAA